MTWECLLDGCFVYKRQREAGGSGPSMTPVFAPVIVGSRRSLPPKRIDSPDAGTGGARAFSQVESWN